MACDGTGICICYALPAQKQMFSHYSTLLRHASLCLRIWCTRHCNLQVPSVWKSLGLVTDWLLAEESIRPLSMTSQGQHGS